VTNELDLINVRGKLMLLLEPTLILPQGIAAHIPESFLTSKLQGDDLIKYIG
jgi:hypothetical protein